MSRLFASMKIARNAMCLDMGFDPFMLGGLGRCTKQKLAEMGYTVDPTALKKRDEERNKLPEAGLFCWAMDCGGREGDGQIWDYDVRSRGKMPRRSA